MTALGGLGLTKVRGQCISTDPLLLNFFEYRFKNAINIHWIGMDAEICKYFKISTGNLKYLPEKTKRVGRGGRFCTSLSACTCSAFCFCHLENLLNYTVNVSVIIHRIHMWMKVDKHFLVWTQTISSSSYFVFCAMFFSLSLPISFSVKLCPLLQ